MIDKGGYGYSLGLMKPQKSSMLRRTDWFMQQKKTFCDIPVLLPKKRTASIFRNFTKNKQKSQ